MKKLLFAIGVLLWLAVIFIPDSQQPKNEAPADISPLQEYKHSTPLEPIIVPELADDFPEAALSILESFRRIESGFHYKEILSRLPMYVGNIGGRGPHMSPYVYYDVNKSYPSIDNSIFTKVDNFDWSIIRKIVGDDSVEDFLRGGISNDFRLIAFISYGNPTRFNSSRLKDNVPLNYESFLLSVFLSLSEIKIGMQDSVYLSFVEEVLLPLSHDLAQKGPARPPIVVDDAFIARMTRYVQQDRSKLPKWLYPTRYLIGTFSFPEPVPHEILWSGIYRKIDHLIRDGHYKDPYYLYKYYRTLPTEGDDVIAWGEALDVDIWCNYYVTRLVEYQLAEKVDEIKTLMLNLRRCDNVF